MDYSFTSKCLGHESLRLVQYPGEFTMPINVFLIKILFMNKSF